jgi:hypothetical protein
MVDTCELCMRNKAARPPGRDGALPSVTVGERVHIDIIIMAVEAATGERVIALDHQQGPAHEGDQVHL